MKMDRQKFGQSCATKFCVKVGESATVTYEKLQRAYGEHSLFRAQVFRWHKCSDGTSLQMAQVFRWHNCSDGTSVQMAQVFRWHKSFLEGREQVEDVPRENLWLKENQSHYFFDTPCMLAVEGKFV